MSESENESEIQEITVEFGDENANPAEGDTDAASADGQAETTSTSEESEETEQHGEPQKPLDPLTAAQQEATKWKDAALRAKADLENFRKRMARQRADDLRFANMDLLQALFPILDNFEMGLQAAKAEDGSMIYLGMQMVLKQIQDFLVEQGIESIEATGQTFDPKLHDAVAQEPSDEVPEGQVVFQVRRGYRLHDRLLRPAAVHVSTGTARQETSVVEDDA